MRKPNSKQPTFKKHPLTIAVQACCYTLLGGLPLANANPTGGQVVGGSGTISQSGTNTTINQATQNLAINWQTFNVQSNERVQFIQPNASAIALNRILSNNGSTIAGRIDANGKVILVNPNGIFFTSTASLNVGSLIASGLDINPSDFMNGKYVFNEIGGTSGKVVNNGLINASLGGNVALIGKEVKNDGIITANLGTVTLAAGKQAVLTFDNDGLLGVRVTQEVLQSELGVDPAVINNGEIQAQGGRVLLTASQSQDVFTRAVNTGNIEQATSVVVNDDGTFTLGGGADVLNTGSIDVSTSASNQNAGRIVLIGENVTSSGTLKADAQSGNGGEIELHARDMMLLTENSLTLARSESDGLGGIVKVLGDKVGLFDQSTVDVSGANGGGQVLIGGDFQGKNKNIRNASETIINPYTNIYADALKNGNGGKVIAWSDGNTYFLGNIYARGGSISGDGGLVETSGKENLLFSGYADRTATNGSNGTLLLDPQTINICSGGGGCGDENSQLSGGIVSFGEGSGTSEISASALVTALSGGSVILQATQDIVVDADINASSNNANSLTLLAGDDVTINNQINLIGGNLTLVGGTSGCGTSCSPDSNSSGSSLYGRNIRIDESITTTGSVTLHAADNVFINNFIGVTSSRPSSVTVRAGNNITVDAINSNNVGTIISNGAVSLTAADTTLTTGTNPTIAPNTTTPAGNVIVFGDIASNGGNFTATTTGNFNSSISDSFRINAGSGNVGITAASVTLGGVTTTSAGANTANLDVTSTSGTITQSTSTAQNLIIGGAASFDAGTNDITLSNTSNQIAGTIALTGGVTSLYNSINTVLGTVSATTLSVQSTAGLRLSGNVTTTGTTQLDFGSGGASTFTVDSFLTLNMSGPVTVTGGGQADAFVIGTMFTGQLVGNGGSDTLTGPNAAVGLANNWQVTNANLGTLTQDDITTNPSTPANTGTITFNGISNLIGGTGVDIFTVNAGGSIVNVSGGQGNDIVNVAGSVTGLIDGDAGSDTFNVLTAGRIVKLGTVAGTADLFVDHVEAINATGAGNTLIGHNATALTTWGIDNPNHGTVSYTSNSSTTVTFDGFQSLTGGTGSDTFTMGATGTISSINGGTGMGVDTLVARQGVENLWTYTTTTSGSLAQAGTPPTTYVTSFSNIENFTGSGTDWANVGGLGSVNVGSYIGFAGIIGNGISSTLVGTAGMDTFTLQLITDATPPSGTNDGSNDGTVAFGSNTLRFIDFGNLNGDDGNDRFVMTTSGSVTGSINGGLGINTLVGRNATTLNTTSTWNINGLNSGNVSELETGVTYVAGFSNIQDLVGGNGNDDFVFGASGQLSNAGVGGLIDGGLGSNTLDVSAPSVVNVTLNRVSTDGALRAVNLGSITGNGQNSTLTGDNASNDWQIGLTILGVNNPALSSVTWTPTGQMVPTSVQFSGFTTLHGGSGVDTFTVNSFVGVLNAIGTIHGNGSADIFSVRGNVGTLNGGDGNDVFTVYATGRTTGNLNGDGGDDSFTVVTGGVVSGTVDGGLNTTAGDQLFLGDNATINLGQAIGTGGVAVTNVEVMTSNNGTINARSAYNSFWNITGLDSGNVRDENAATGAQGVSIQFNGFNKLNGSDPNGSGVGGIDSFTVSGNGALSADGRINAGGGADSLTVTLSNTRSAGSVYFLGGNGNDTVTYTGVSDSGNYVATTQFGANTYDGIAYTGTNGVSFGAYYNNAETIADQTSATSLTVNGSAIVLGSVAGPTNQFAVNSRTAVSFSGKQNFTAVGTGTVNSVNFISDFSVPNRLTLRNINNVTQTGGTELTMARLSLDTVNFGGNAPAALALNGGTLLDVTNSGPVSVTSNAGVTLNQISTAGALTVVAASDITETNNEQRNASGAVTLVSSGGNIILSEANSNYFSGPLSLSGATVNINNSTSTNFASATATSLIVNSGGDITQTGAIVAPAATLTASGRNVTLNNVGNDFNNLTITADAVAVTDLSVAGPSIASGLITANTVVLTTANGIGSPVPDSLSTPDGPSADFVTNTASLTIGNLNGGVYVQNRQAATVRITNNGAIGLQNDGNLVIDRLYTNGNSINADNLGYSDVFLRVTSGNVQGLIQEGRSVFTTPDITASNLFITVQNGGIGTQVRPISIAVDDTFTYLGARGYVHYFGRQPRNLVGVDDLITFSAFDFLSGLQLLEVESLDEFDPAIFTEVRNYYYEDVAIMMPADQRLDGSDEDEKEGEKEGKL